MEPGCEKRSDGRGGEGGALRQMFLGGGSALTFVPVLQGGHHVEADGLVGALLQHGGGETLVRPSQSWEGGAVRQQEGGGVSLVALLSPTTRWQQLGTVSCTLSPDDLFDPVEEAPVPGVGRCLVVDELDLER